MAHPVRPEEGDSMNAFECRTSRTATLGSAVPGILQNPNEWRRWGAAALVSLIIAAALGISAARAGATTTDALAEVNGEAITAKELETRLGAKVSQLEEQIYALKRAELDALIAQHLLAQEAAKRGIPVAALMDAEVTRRRGGRPPPDPAAASTTEAQRPTGRLPDVATVRCEDRRSPRASARGPRRRGRGGSARTRRA
jgi:hypothetical protein